MKQYHKLDLRQVAGQPNGEYHAIELDEYRVTFEEFVDEFEEHDIEIIALEEALERGIVNDDIRGRVHNEPDFIYVAYRPADKDNPYRHPEEVWFVGLNEVEA